MTDAGDVAAIVLAGGRSERFGHRDKLRASIDGDTLLERAVAAVAIVADDVVVVLAPTTPETDVPPPARAAHDPTEGEGPLAGVHAGLLAAARSDVAVVVAGDMPDIQPDVLRLMLDAVADPDTELVALHDGEGPRPLPLAVRTRPATDAASALLAAGERRLRALVGALELRVLDEPTWTAIDPARRTLHDVDEPEDLNG